MYLIDLHLRDLFRLSLFFFSASSESLVQDKRGQLSKPQG